MQKIHNTMCELGHAVATRDLGPGSLAQRLGAYLARQGAGLPFDWQANNCCHFAAGWVWCNSGIKVLAGLPDTPSAIAAKRLVVSLGGSLAAAWSRQLGQQPVAPLQARLGDLVLVNLQGLPGPADAGSGEQRGIGQAVGICAGRTVVAIDRAGACVHLPLSFGVAAWRLPVSAFASRAAAHGEAA